MRRAVEINPNLEACYFHLAAALALADCFAEAAEARAVGQRLAPSVTISRYCRNPRSDNPIYLARRERLMEGMRKAGVPE